MAFVNDKLTGTVKRVIDKRQVLLLLDDGFEIPASTNELVVTERIGGIGPPPAADDKTIIAEVADTSDKLYFGAVAEDTGKGYVVKMYLVNTKSQLAIFSLLQTTGGFIKGIAHGSMEPSRAMKIATIPLIEVSEYRNMLLQVMYYPGSANFTDTVPAPQQYPFTLKPVALLKEQSLIPVINQRGLLLNLSDLHLTKGGNAATVPKANLASAKPEAIPDIIDLHLEELTETPKKLVPQEALDLQIRVFNNFLDKAIARDMDSITFIHGVGQGRLKQEIRKVLGLNPYIQGFDDADHKKFGYGATIVFLKKR